MLTALSRLDGYGQIHFRKRRLNRPGLYRFLKLAARSISGSGTLGRAYRTWIEATTAYDLGLQVGVRFPRRYSETERAEAVPPSARNWAR